MTQVEQELDFGAVPIKAEDFNVFVPIHADNWALALASGYLGGSLKSDQAQDLQTLFGGDVAAFVDSVPSWAMSEGEGGPRVVLRLAVANRPEAGTAIQVITGPVRVTDVQETCFDSKDALDNFQASYGLFPDVPVSLVPSVVGGYNIVEAEKPVGLAPVPDRSSFDRRRKLDFLGGWAAAVLSILDTAGNDAAISRFLAEGERDLEGLAEKSLRAFDQSAAELDVAIWKAAIAGLFSRYGKRGFDRQDFLDEIEDRVGKLSTDAAAWIQGCRRVVNAELDIPNLDDKSNLGRRAALALMLAHEPSSVDELESTLGVGTKVRSLVMQAVYAFAGLARLDASNKFPAARLNGLLSIVDALENGTSLTVESRPERVGADLSRIERITISGNGVLERTVQPPPYLLMLKARAQEAGYQVTVDQELGELVIKAKRPKSPSIFVEDNDRSSVEQPVVNLVLPLAKLGARPMTSALKAYLELAFNQATTVGLRRSDEVEEVCAMVSIPLATLDRDEFTFHVERLLSLWEQALGKRSKKVPTRSSGGRKSKGE